MKKIKESRAVSFAVIIAVYILAAVVGFSVYRLVSLPWWWALMVSDAAATVLTFIFSVIFGNASVYDPYWSVQPPVIIAAFAAVCSPSSLGIVLLTVVSVWGVRLTANWAYTFHGLCHQDWRYTMLKESTGKFYPIINFIGIHMVPTLIVYACTLPAVYAIINRVSVNFGSLVAICISVFAIILQGTSDFQMHKFRKSRTGTFIRSGLWRHSRHPNYLGEILMWWGVALSVVAAVPNAWYLTAGAFLNTILFFTVSIPMADGRQSKKSGFEEYKRETHALLPIKRSH